jgi:hypothetical protein
MAFYKTGIQLHILVQQKSYKNMAISMMCIFAGLQVFFSLLVPPVR